MQGPGDLPCKPTACQSYEKCDVNGLLRASNGIRWVLEKYAFATAWLLVVLMCVTCFDVAARRFGLATWLGIPGS